MKADESADCAVLCLARLNRQVARQRTAQSALSWAFMVFGLVVKNVFRITRIWVEVSFSGAEL